MKIAFQQVLLILALREGLASRIACHGVGRQGAVEPEHWQVPLSWRPLPAGHVRRTRPIVVIKSPVRVWPELAAIVPVGRLGSTQMAIMATHPAFN